MSMNVKKVRTVALPASATAGAATEVSDLHSAYVVVGGTFDATWQVQMSLDGTHWVDVGSPMADAGAAVSIPDAAMQVRINCPSDFTSNASGSASVGGLKDRSADGA